MNRKLENLSYEERLRELWLFSLEKAPWRPYSSLLIYKGGLTRKLEWNFLQQHVVYRTRGNSFKLKEEDLD